MNTFYLLPENVKNWLSTKTEEEIHDIFKAKIYEGILSLGFEVTDINAAGLMEEYDNKYFELNEKGDKKAFEYFSIARLLSSFIFFKSCDTPNAIYEYIHSLKWEDPIEIIKQIDGA